MRTKVVVAGALVAVLVLAGVAGTAVVLAQGPTPTAPNRANFEQLFWQALANKLGISVPTLQQDFADARKDAVNQAVKQGLITQAQADQMLQRLQNVPLGNSGFMRGFKQGVQRGLGQGQLRGFFGPDVLEAIAGVLKMQPGDVTTALRGGKTLADLAKQQNVDAAKVQVAIADAEKAALDRAVKDGLITQAQADQRKAQIDPTKIDLTQKSLGRGPFKRQ